MNDIQHRIYKCCC